MEAPRCSHLVIPTATALPALYRMHIQIGLVSNSDALGYSSSHDVSLIRAHPRRNEAKRRKRPMGLVNFCYIVLPRYQIQNDKAIDPSLDTDGAKFSICVSHVAHSVELTYDGRGNN